MDPDIVVISFDYNRFYKSIESRYNVKSLSFIEQMVPLRWSVYWAFMTARETHRDITIPGRAYSRPSR